MILVPVSAQNAFVSLRPLEEAHRLGLRQAANDPDIWRHWLVDVSTQGFDAWFDYMLAQQAAGAWIPHTVFDADGQAIGQTCYLDIRQTDKGVEIGGTWYHPKAHATKVNPSCKLLLCEHAILAGAHRIALKTDALNARSRAAISKLGATFEGVLRQDKMRSNGTLRDTAYFSILASEWPDVKANLLARLEA
jgi:N-acetyltransferase